MCGKGDKINPIKVVVVVVVVVVVFFKLLKIRLCLKLRGLNQLEKCNHLY